MLYFPRETKRENAALRTIFIEHFFPIVSNIVFQKKNIYIYIGNSSEGKTFGRLRIPLVIYMEKNKMENMEMQKIARKQRLLEISEIHGSNKDDPKARSSHAQLVPLLLL